MGKREPLPDPQLVEQLDDCLGCGYCLVGIPAPGLCPECGLEFDGGVSVLLIAGVAKGLGGPWWRKVIWISIFVLAFVYAQLLMVLMMAFPWIGLVIFLILISSTAAMAMTNAQKKRGTEMFAFTCVGFSRWIVGADPSTREFRAWDGIEPGVIIRRVSSVWASIKIMDFNEQGKRNIILEGGFRCPARDLGMADRLINHLACGQAIEDFEETEGMGTIADWMIPAE